MIPRTKKIIIWSVSLPVGLFLTVTLFSFLKIKYADYQWYKKTAAFVAAGEAPFRADTYGGKTPEETWALYVEAVKKRDIELASKYYDVNHQQKEKEYLQQGLNTGKWDLYINDITKNFLQKDTSTPDWLTFNKERAYYFYQWKDQKNAKINTVPVNFYLNTFTHVWKILY